MSSGSVRHRHVAAENRHDMHLLRFVLSSARLYHVTAEMGILSFVLSLFFIYWFFTSCSSF
ncbi:uncharacterized protein DS421_17g590930 [Arachis hypogaea]|nr:uncharacterized protein DS421_17g590930 [Arachis hypogaea]